MTVKTIYQTKIGGLLSASVIAACSICSAKPIFAGEECGPATSSEIICDQAANVESIYYKGASSAFNTKTLIIDNPNLNVGITAGPNTTTQRVFFRVDASTEVVDLFLWLKNIGEVKFDKKDEIRVQNDSSGSSTIRMDAGNLTTFTELTGQNDGLYSLVDNNDEGTTSRIILRC